MAPVEQKPAADGIRQARFLRFRSAVGRVKSRDPVIRAFVTTRLKDAEREFEDLKSLTSPQGLLHGVPYALKDMWDTAGIPTTAGSFRYRHRIPETDSPVHDVCTT